ncbi:unnamed protein product [Adineta ricciae]|uniref:G-protein coupled receptors family 1 profile domain-containing protein n=1 Tax=Adineta ricciae TaxID=249248 RepID=A0A815GH18_ADIRI|nr:unnamed protein product [Adineta ricciae]
MSSHFNESVVKFSETTLSRYSKFSVFLVLEPPSVLCNSLFVFYLIKDRNLRLAIHHHAILALLIVSLLTNLIEIPRILHYLRTGSVGTHSSISCLLWQWLDYLFYGQANLLMLWASFERHILVFHGYLVSTSRGRLLIHYLPLLFIVFYLIFFYIIVIFFHSCEKQFDFTSPLCGQPCFTQYPVISLYDLFAHSWLPTFFITLFSVALVIRVINRKRPVARQDIPWRKHRRMILQLLSISTLYFSCMGPYTLIQVIDSLIGLPSTAAYIKNVYLFYVYWLLTLLLPYVCIGCLPEVTNKIRRQVKNWNNRENMIMPTSLT